MKEIACKLILLPLLLCFFTAAYGQASKTLPSEPAEFIEAFTNQIHKLKKKELSDWADGFTAKWSGGAYTAQEQQLFINQMNVMLLKNHSVTGEGLQYARVFELLKSEQAYIKIPVEDFFDVTDSVILRLDRPKNQQYLNFLLTFLQDGSAFKTSNSSWKFSQTNPKLSFTTFHDESRYQTFYVPMLTFSSTDLVYGSTKDSSRIINTKGELNIMNRVFRADGGRVTWEKMQLNPDEVYCDFKDYMVNLNYSFIKADSVTFFYKGLIDRPLIGKYEDVNRGYSNINDANFPHFKSYEGGVVIENLIPNVRYVGGFSLRGVKKIGSSYWEWRDIQVDSVPDKYKPKEPEVIEEPVNEFEDQNTYNDDGWGDFYSDFDIQYDNSSFYSEDESEDTWDEPEDPEEQPEEDENTPYEEIPMELFEDTLQGKELVQVKAEIQILKQDKAKIKLRSREFVLDLEKLTSKMSEAFVYLAEEDSIYHPNVELLYQVESDEIFLMRTTKGPNAQTPFMSPWHNYYLYFEAIKTQRTSDTLFFTSIIDKQNKVSAIESKDFFKKERFQQFKGVMRFNPITAIYKAFRDDPFNPITPERVVGQWGFNKTEYQEELDKLMLMMKALEGSGFIVYNPVTRVIKPKQKLFDWAEGVRDMKDYDAIQLLSQVGSGSNGVLNMNSKTLLMQGVKFFSLSDSQFVRCLPYKEEVMVKEDRWLEFGGVVAGGKLNFYGYDTSANKTTEKFKFDYENYKILCDSLDSLRFILVRNVPPGYQMSPLQTALRNTSIEGVTGAIYINKPNNKNGLDAHPEYPIFDSYTNSYVYWYKPQIRNGVYAKDKLFFSIDPFVLDSLETFEERALSFEGEFYSSEIFPKFRQKLVVMDDYTLGLKQIIPEDSAVGAYDDKGKYSGEVLLDGSGMYGKGKMDFLATTAQSDTFEFYFDSVKAVTNEFYMPPGERDGAYFPEIKASVVHYKWLTKKDEIELESAGVPIDLFGGEGSFVGKLIITPEGLKGKGTITMGEVSITSDDIIFNEKDFKAKDATFKVSDEHDPTKYHFIAENMDVDYDVTKHYSTFQTTKTGEPNVEFPMQNYKTSLGKGEYDKTKKKIVLESNSVKIKDNYFFSTDPKQDSLAFYGKNAVYDLQSQQVDVSSVPYIYVADAKVIPDSLKLTIRNDGYIKTLRNATIEANLETKYHTITESDVEIFGAYNYSAEGKYDYITINDQPQYINLTSIRVQPDTTTFAEGTIPEEQNFRIAERFFFKGKTEMTAENKYMRFNGEVKIESDNEFFQNTWFPFDAVVNPDSVFIKIRPEDLEKNKLTVGLHYIPRYRLFYSTFLQPLKNPKDDQTLLQAFGGITFDPSTQEFRIGPESKIISQQTYKGAVVSFNDVENTITTRGLIPLPYAFEKNTISVKVAGSWKDDMKNETVTTDLLMGITMEAIPKEAWDKLAEKFKILTVVNEDIDFNSRLLQESAAEFLDPGEGEEKNTKAFVESLKDVIVYTDIKLAKSLPMSLLLSNVNFQFDEDNKSLYHNGPLGVVGINGNNINKQVNAKMEYNIGKLASSGLRYSDTLRIYLEVDEFNWAYFSFYDDVVYTWSSDLEGYNAILAEEIGKRKKDEGYRFELADDLMKDRFLSEFIKRYIWKE